jgi:hypothetical protein
MDTTTSPIRGASLQAFAEQDERQRASVIVEAKRPAAKLPAAVAAKPGTSPRQLLPARRKAADATRAAQDSPTASARSMHAVELALSKLGLKERARRNDLVGCFVVEVTPSQLKELAQSPAVQAIRANRLRRKL